MKTTWLKGLSDDQKMEMRKDFLSSLRLRQRLVEICNDKIDTSNSSMRSKDAYGIPNWAYLQADAIGYERALNEIISLIEQKNVE